jgi:hypothetical protein
MITYSFIYELPSGQACEVECDITPLEPARINCAPEDAYPAEGGYAEITSVTVSGEALEGDRVPTVELNLDDVWIRTRGQKFELYLDDLAATAYDKWIDEQ